MFCARCGQQIPDASVFCQICGREATLKLSPASAAPPVEPRTPYAFVTVPQNLGPSGVGGWLWWYCFNATVLGPLFVFARMSAWHIQDLLYSTEQIRLLYGALVGAFLWMERPIAILLLRAYFIIVGVDFLLTYLRLISLAQARHSALFRVAGFNTTMVAVGIAIAWLIYFRKSERVRNTYGANI